MWMWFRACAGGVAWLLTVLFVFQESPFNIFKEYFGDGSGISEGFSQYAVEMLLKDQHMLISALLAADIAILMLTSKINGDQGGLFTKVGAVVCTLSVAILFLFEYLGRTSFENGAFGMDGVNLGALIFLIMMSAIFIVRTVSYHCNRGTPSGFKPLKKVG